MRALLGTLLVAGNICAAASETDLGSPAIFTPYDSAFASVKEVLSRAHNPKASFEDVARLMRAARQFHYRRAMDLISPEATQAMETGDCKAKSLWLCEQIGDPEIRFVIGKLNRKSARDHAWLLWKNDDRWWILDCTNARTPIPAAQVRTDKYVPYYSYTRNGDYRHRATGILIASTANPQ